jgi:hypothetical protein
MTQFDQLRQQLLLTLAALSREQQRSFRLLYGRNDMHRSEADALTVKAETIVNELQDGYLEMALTHATSVYEHIKRPWVFAAREPQLRGFAGRFQPKRRSVVFHDPYRDVLIAKAPERIATGVQQCWDIKRSQHIHDELLRWRETSVVATYELLKKLFVDDTMLLDLLEEEGDCTEPEYYVEELEGFISMDLPGEDGVPKGIGYLYHPDKLPEDSDSWEYIVFYLWLAYRYPDIFSEGATRNG